MTDRLKIGQEVLIHGYVDEIRKDTVIIRNEGGYFGTVECEITDIEMPNTNDVLDKIRAEIMDFEEELFHRPNTDYADYAAVRHCVEIIDKHLQERSDKE